MSSSLSIDLPGGSSVSALLDRGAPAVASYLFAHGAGAGMTHGFMATAARGLAERGVTVLRFQFPSMEAGSRRPDRPAVAQAAVRAAAATLRALGPEPLYAGGKSFGGRMTSQAQAEAPLEGVRGLVFFGFPLHPAGKPAVTRAEHLAQVRLPMLFLQGTRDALAEAPLLAEAVASLRDRAELVTIAGADHGFHVPRSSGRSDAEAMSELLDRAAAWIRAVAEGTRGGARGGRGGNPG
jgi:uncharacterized protein